MLTNSKGRPAKNPQLIKRVYDLLEKGDVDALFAYGESSKVHKGYLTCWPAGRAGEDHAVHDCSPRLR